MSPFTARTGQKQSFKQEETFMERISRRKFLKTAGAAVLTVGAAGMLSGCSMSDLIGAALPIYGDAQGHAAENANGAMFALSNECRWWSMDGKLALFRTTFQVKNMTDHDVTFHASDIKSATLNGYPARVILDPEHGAKISVVEQGDKLFDQTTGSRTYAPSNNMNSAINSYLYFEPIYPEGDAGIQGDWSNFEMTFTFAGKETTFVMNMDSNRHVTSARK